MFIYEKKNLYYFVSIFGLNLIVLEFFFGITNVGVKGLEMYIGRWTLFEDA